MPQFLAGDKNQPHICVPAPQGCAGQAPEQGIPAPRNSWPHSGVEAEPQGEEEFTSPRVLEPPLPSVCTQARQAPPNLATDTAFCVPGSALTTQGWQLSPAEPWGQRGSSCHTIPVPTTGTLLTVSARGRIQPLPAFTDRAGAPARQWGLSRALPLGILGFRPLSRVCV